MKQRRDIKGRVGLLAGLLLLLPSLGMAVTYEVHVGQSIADALALAGSDDTVLLHPGTYYETHLMIPSGVTLASFSDDPEQRAVLDNGGIRTILICENLSAETRVQGIIFQGPVSPELSGPQRGGAVRCENAPVRFVDCVFSHQWATYGGAVYARGGMSPQFENCVFSHNFARAGGGALNLVGAKGLLLDGCLFTHNSAIASGCVLNLSLRSSGTIVNCTLADNGRVGVADIGCWDSQLLEINNTIMTGSFGRALFGDFSGTPEMGCTDIHDNSGGDWIGAVASHLDQDGNISADPLYCGDAGETSPWQLDEGSPCVTDPVCGIMGALGIGCDTQSGTDGVEGLPSNGNSLPLVTRLRGNFPNPFNPRTTISFDVSQAGPVALEIYDLAGRRVRSLQSGTLAVGRYDRIWNGRNDGGRMCAAGVYFTRLKTETVIDTQRLTLVK